MSLGISWIPGINIINIIMLTLVVSACKGWSLLFMQMCEAAGELNLHLLKQQT